MPQEHIVRQGECLSSIAEEYGFFPQTIWNDPANSKLRATRRDGNVLFPGDALVIPDKRPRSEAGATGMRHRFLRRGVPAKLRLRLVGHDGPRAGVRYVLDIDGKLYHGVTDADGRIDVLIPPNARRGKLIMADEEEYDIHLGTLDPVTEEAGIRKRLFNLGYLAKASADSTVFREAVRQFQKANGITETGQPDSSTQTKLVQVHGS